MIFVRKLISKIEEGGSYEYALIAYKKHPMQFKTICEDGHCTTKPITFVYILRIDLWIIILDFKWETKIK